MNLRSPEPDAGRTPCLAARARSGVSVRDSPRVHRPATAMAQSDGLSTRSTPAATRDDVDQARRHEPLVRWRPARTPTRWWKPAAGWRPAGVRSDEECLSPGDGRPCTVLGQYFPNTVPC